MCATRMFKILIIQNSRTSYRWNIRSNIWIWTVISSSPLMDWRLRIPRPNSTQILVKGTMIIFICAKNLKKYCIWRKNKMTMISLTDMYLIWKEVQYDYRTLNGKVQNLDKILKRLYCS